MGGKGSKHKKVTTEEKPKAAPEATQPKQEAEEKKMEKPTVDEIYHSIPKETLDKVEHKNVKSGCILRFEGGSVNQTSKINKFHEKTSVKQAIAWFLKENGAEVALIFDGDSSLSFRDYKFDAYEDLDD